MLFISAVQNLLNSKNQQVLVPEVKQEMDSQDIGRLLQFEELFHDHSYQLSHVDAMLQLYAQIVDNLDISQQSMKQYFLEKMQYLLSRPETIRLMMGDQFVQENSQTRISALRMTSGTTQLKQEEENRFHRPFLQTMSPDIPKMRYSVQKTKQQRALQMKICIEVEENKPEQRKDLKQLLVEYENTSKEFDTAVRQQLSDQNQRLQDRVARRNGIRKERQSTSQEPKSNGANQEGPLLQRQKLITQIEESVSFMRLSINRLRK